LTSEFPTFSAHFTEDKWETDKNGKYCEKPSSLPQETHDKVMFFLCRMFLSCNDSSRDELDASSYPMVQDKTTSADRPHSFHDTTFIELVQPLLAILACKAVSSNHLPSAPFFAKGSADLVLSFQAKAFMHKKFIQAILPHPLEAFIHYIVCKQIVMYHLDQMIAHSRKSNSGIGFLAKEGLMKESDKWCDKVVNPQCQPSMRAKEMDANLLVYKMLLKKVKTEHDSITSLCKMYKQDKAKYDHHESSSTLK
jgi:hypothetical protein